MRTPEGERAILERQLHDLLTGAPPGGVRRVAGAVWSQLQELRLAAAQRVGREGAPQGLIVEGLSLGGSGRTPVVACLARRLGDAGLQVAVVGHGYGGRGGGLVRRVAGDAARDGDEAVELAQALPGVPVLIGNRAEAWEHAARGAGVVVCDGGLADRALRALAPGLAVMVADATVAPHPFPAGYLRYALASARRADLRWAHRVDEPDARPLDAEVESVWRATGLRAPDGEGVPLDILRRGRWVALSGIARPGSFHTALAGLGAALVERRVFADHHPFRAGDVDLPSGAEGVTTAKDAARLPPGHRLHVLVGGVEVWRGEAALSAFLDHFRARR